MTTMPDDARRIRIAAGDPLPIFAAALRCGQDATASPGAEMSETPAYEPPKVWTWNKENGGQFDNINRPVARPTHDKELPVGCHPLQLYSLATPNGVKATVMREELLALGKTGAEYDAWLIRINQGDQFGSGFVAVN